MVCFCTNNSRCPYHTSPKEVLDHINYANSRNLTGPIPTENDKHDANYQYQIPAPEMRGNIPDFKRIYP